MGRFDRTPSVAGYPDYKYGTSSATPLLGRLASGAGGEQPEAEYNKVLRPVLDFLLLAAVLLPWKLWWDLAEEQCWDPSSYKATELTLLRVTRGVWIAWLTHAAGLIDEALRVFLGIRLTMGLGSPTSVDKTYTKMSRRAEIVAEVRMWTRHAATCIFCCAFSLRRLALLSPSSAFSRRRAFRLLYGACSRPLTGGCAYVRCVHHARDCSRPRSCAVKENGLRIRASTPLLCM